MCYYSDHSDHNEYKGLKVDREKRRTSGTMLLVLGKENKNSIYFLYIINYWEEKLATV